MEKRMNFVEVKHDGVIGTNDIFEIFSNFSLECRKEYYKPKEIDKAQVYHVHFFNKLITYKIFSARGSCG